MPAIRQISELKDNIDEISEYCHSTNEPVYLTENGHRGLVVMSLEALRREQSRVKLFTLLEEAEEEIANGDEGQDFLEFAEEMRKTIHGTV